ncbi:hypothetical protein CFC21_005792 [Triticum aestivum]|uniref:DYW domain-containing protein n=1 Tax=Triticum aestivum TaxID=4565 RepID=A0A9R1DAC4_WHEAT|nr:hypothetical protein CFC21_005792 [Triticum aestivum]
MICTGGQPDTVVYQSLIRGFCINDDLVKAKELVSEMINKGIPSPDIVFFSSVIQSLCIEGRVMDAHDILHLVIHIGERPGVLLFNSLVNGCCLAGKVYKLSDYLMPIPWNQLEHKVVTYSTLPDCYCKMERSIMVRLCSKKSGVRELHPNCYIWHRTGWVFRAGRTVAARKMFHEMTESGIAVSISI